MPATPSCPPTAKGLSLLDTRALSTAEIGALFASADRLARNFALCRSFVEPGNESQAPRKIVACLFFEASTRTLMSFHTAALRLGHDVITFDTGTGSSMLKGETEEDTVLNVAAMNPDVLVIRYNRSPGLDTILPRFPIPVISAGTGTQSHPTQALLDAYTIRKHRGSLTGQRVLIVGDITHSRVARSNFDVLKKLGAEIAICGPEEFLPSESEIPDVRIFRDLETALNWPTVFMGLRIQTERHDDAATNEKGRDDFQNYHARFGLSQARARKLSADALILHPGPINHGVEFAPEIAQDPRACILDQVTNGVLIRAALLAAIFEGRQK